MTSSERPWRWTRSTPPRPPGPARRIADLAIATLALLVASPALAAIPLAIRIKLGSPILFRQERAGERGRPFQLIKFRTMLPPEAAGGELGTDDEARLVPLGRWLRASSLDELPQLLNVVNGDMAIIGPRPLPVAYAERYSPAHARRLALRPGMTGLPQVLGRNSLTWDEKFDMDVWYDANRSLRTDLWILWRTAVTLLHHDGIAHPGHASMPPFHGSGLGSDTGAADVSHG